MTARPEIILGSPGCGKTEALLKILEEELERDTEPERVAFVSFTKQAAEVGISRASAKLGLPRERFPNFRTLHSLCYRWLGIKPGEVLEGPRLREFADYAGVALSGKHSEDDTMTGFETGDRALFIENLARTRMQTPEEAYDADRDDVPYNEVARVAAALRQFKSERMLRDFTDMLTEAADDCVTADVDVLIVDEVQDLSKLQWLVVESLRRGVRRFVVGGDDDQCIHEWAGSDASALIDLGGDVRVLGQSYRVPRRVQEIALRIIGRVSRRRPKEWAPRAEGGVVDVTRRVHDVDFDGDDVMVLARNSFLLREQVIPELRAQGVIYERLGQPSVSHDTVAAIRMWERLRAGGDVSVTEARQVYRLMASRVGVTWGHKALPGFQEDEERVTAADLRARGGLLADGPWYEALTLIPPSDVEYIRRALRRGIKLGERPRVRVSTIHSAKGAEADHVVLLTEVGRKTAREAERTPDSEARVWYVGVTRARSRLTLVESRTAYEYRI